MYPSLLNMFQRKRLLSPDEEESSNEDTSFQDLVPQRETPFLSGLREHLGSMPQREDYKPSFGRKLLSGLLGSLGSLATRNAGYGVNLADQFANVKYNTALSDFATKEKVLREGAGLENQQLNRDINYAGKLGTFRHQRNTEDETKRYHDTQIENQLRDDARAEDEGANRQNNADRAYEASRERLRLQGERNSILRSKINKPPKPPSQLETNRQATSALLRDYPEYGGFLNQSGQPKPPKSTGDANQDQLVQTQYKRFLTHYQLYMNKYNKTQNTSQFPDLPIEELYDTDNDTGPDEDMDDER